MVGKNALPCSCASWRRSWTSSRCTRERLHPSCFPLGSNTSCSRTSRCWWSDRGPFNNESENVESKIGMMHNFKVNINQSHLTKVEPVGVLNFCLHAVYDVDGWKWWNLATACNQKLRAPICSTLLDLPWPFTRICLFKFWLVKCDNTILAIVDCCAPSKVSLIGFSFLIWLISTVTDWLYLNIRYDHPKAEPISLSIKLVYFYWLKTKSPEQNISVTNVGLGAKCR